MQDRPKTLRPTDDTTRAAVARMIVGARLAALAFTHPDTGFPFVSRIAVAPFAPGLMTLVSDLSLHTRALAAAPDAALLIGDPPGKGDPLNHPRLGLSVRARPLEPDMLAAAREGWLGFHPKSKLYIDFADFRLLRFDLLGGALTEGFARAYALTAQDLALP
jgi:hypothetical protein